MPKLKRLSVKEKKFVTAKVQGKDNKTAYKEAGYSLSVKPTTMATAAARTNRKPHIQKAIDDALTRLKASPEFAVEQIMKVAEQDKELTPKLKASEKILELHGWNKTDRPTLQLDIRNAFFNGGRKEEVIESETNT